MDEIKLYENKEIRSVWDEEKEEWYFSVVDVVGALMEQENARGASTYWAVLKKRLKKEGNELLINCKQFRL
ncbi:hypothetical protein IX329_000849 [Fusobacterium necrophorum]|uniref:Phage antirepressor protein n=1 Tax=Fusobacterium necrophorum BL TaxID=1441732 RepID=A0AB73BVK3_9FUSO|nr:hypothetical protein [Fusobacterium necrophorum]KDE62591.1 hypothetical protein FUSO3_07460 [Fusobacterium necrophorum BL]KDE73253.1 hypothetical protein FUSO7_06975 [Fusobacterium necrophorum BFTR-2]MBR8733275.1 hypothetical protein [Fusobacterium necrophorum]MBR8789452.1 hypothetical protein [Fusobacterium necrophorum]SDB33978.1 hypothetical protein SAMN02983009_01633 [Fusobacterium necrophorum]